MADRPTNGDAHWNSAIYSIVCCNLVADPLAGFLNNDIIGHLHDNSKFIAP